MSCYVNGSLFTEVLPLCGCWTFLKTNKSPGLQTSFGSLWTCAQCAGGPLSEVFCTGSACTCTESTHFAVIAIVAGVEDLVVLKGVSVSGAVGTVLGLYWHLQDLEDVGCTIQCTACCTIPCVGIGDTILCTI